MSNKNKRLNINHVIDHLWGTANDSVLWDGWRNYGDGWVMGYLYKQVRRGVYLRGDATRSQLLSRLDAATTA